MPAGIGDGKTLFTRSDSGAFRRVALQRRAEVAGGGLGSPERPALAIPVVGPDQGEVRTLAVIHLREEMEVTPALEQIVAQIRLPLAVAIERERIYRNLEEERQRIYERSIRDPLTGLYTRAHMVEVLGRLMQMHDRDQSATIAVVLLDIDYFKKINDIYGHLAGDEALKTVADVLCSQTRAVDLPVRIGGEEFAIFLPGKAVEGAGIVAERLRLAVLERRLPPPLQGLRISVSGGVAVRYQEESLEDFLERADQALYQAKGRGEIASVSSPQRMMDSGCRRDKLLSDEVGRARRSTSAVPRCPVRCAIGGCAVGGQRAGR